MFFPYININWPQVYMCSSHPETPSDIPPHPIPLGCPRALDLGTLLHASNLQFSSLQFLSRVQLFATPWTAAPQASLSIELALVICLAYGNVHVSMPFSQIIPPLPSPLSLKICNLHLCLLCSPAFRIINTIFLNSIDMH